MDNRDLLIHYIALRGREKEGFEKTAQGFLSALVYPITGLVDIAKVAGLAGLTAGAGWYFLNRYKHMRDVSEKIKLKKLEKEIEKLEEQGYGDWS